MKIQFTNEQLAALDAFALPPPCQSDSDVIINAAQAWRAAVLATTTARKLAKPAGTTSTRNGYYKRARKAASTNSTRSRLRQEMAQALAENGTAEKVLAREDDARHLVEHFNRQQGAAASVAFDGLQWTVRAWMEREEAKL